MPSKPYEREEEVHCIELNTGEALSGKLRIGEEEIRADIYRYDAQININGEAPIFLRTERNLIVSLHSNVMQPLGQSGFPPSVVYHQIILANLAVAGWDKWSETDPVKRVTFQVKHAEQILQHKDKRKHLSKFPSDADRRLFELSIGRLTISASYSGIWSAGSDDPKESWTDLEISFDEPPSIRTYLASVMVVVRFFSFCLGARLKPSEIEVYKITLEEMIRELKLGGAPADYSVEYAWPEDRIDSLDTWVGGSPVRAWDDTDVSNLKECLTAWVSREKDWGNANTLMMGALAAKRTMSVARLIGAFRWFEEIPLTAATQTIDQKHLDTIADAAESKAVEMGYSGIKNRVRGALKVIRTEANEQRFRRLVDVVRGRFGDEILHEAVVADLMKAVELRGKSAHGHLRVESEEEFRTVSRAVRAMEALCFLLTASGLPINDYGVERIHSNPMVRDYRLDRQLGAGAE